MSPNNNEYQTISGEPEAQKCLPDSAGELTPVPAIKTRAAGHAEACPECGGIFIPESGCWVCRNCGYAACG
ncbi:MAG TPA: hypothetical protein P5159_04065 [Phycisphaerae bacterium]|nr:hypothetical protein [Phycisphaerae bacterium]HSA25682.1 hypothetical protein [Phycisphaerae bacterium]